MSNIKDVRCKPRLHDLISAGVWPPCSATFSFFHCRVRTPVIHVSSHADHEKRVAWVSISMHASGSVSIVIALCLAVFWAA